MENEEKKEKPKHSDLVPSKQDVFELYCAWKALPSFFRFPPANRQGNKPTSREFVESMGIDNEQIIELSEIKYQKDFAEKYNIHQDTLSNWNQTQAIRDSMSDIRGWARTLSRNVMMALYNNAIRKGFAVEAKLWFQLVEGWEEKQKHEVNYKGVTEVKIIQDGEQDTNTVVTNNETVSGVEILNG